jgi:hypothetical protein
MIEKSAPPIRIKRRLSTEVKAPPVPVARMTLKFKWKHKIYTAVNICKFPWQSPYYILPKDPTDYWGPCDIVWGQKDTNPITSHASRLDAQKSLQLLYRSWLTNPKQAKLLRRARKELGGKSLACYCSRNAPCHGDVLLELCNSNNCLNPTHLPTTSCSFQRQLP